ncbi:DUF6527 family protein [Bacillaceae bacterium S4-13-56]
MTRQVVEHKFVDFIPDKLKPNTIYISIAYNTVVHSCACGCGEEVVTPLSRSDWKLTYNGETVSLHPSIGNWSFSCRSHYWIRDSRVVWAESWSCDKVKVVREAEKRNIDKDRKNKDTGLLAFFKNLFQR